jgi:hypothetical protein
MKKYMYSGTHKNITYGTVTFLPGRLQAGFTAEKDAGEPSLTVIL